MAHTGLPAATKCWRPNADALIGIILLIAIVKKNGIMMIDFALEAERNHGKKPEDAIHEACLRFRPIIGGLLLSQVLPV